MWQLAPGPNKPPPSVQLVTHVGDVHLQETVRECEGGNGGTDGGAVAGAELEGLQEHRPSAVDQHFLRDLQGPVG